MTCPLTIAVIHRNVRGYPERCLRALAPQAPEGTQFLLITDDLAGAQSASAAVQGLSVLPALDGDRADAKNQAIDKARGELLLLVGSEFVARENALTKLMEFARGSSKPMLASPQMLNENGMRRRSSYRFPLCFRELVPVAPLGGRLLKTSKRPAENGKPRRAAALRASFLLGRTEVFRQVGEFEPGYRFGYEDIEWSWRAARQGVERWVVTDAHAFALAPQLYGEAPAAERLAIERSMLRVVDETRGAGMAALFRAERRMKAVAKWGCAVALDTLLCGRSEFLAQARVTQRALVTMSCPDPLVSDAESRVRWETLV